MVLEKAAVVATYSASAVVTLAGLTISEWVALGGFLVGLATFVVNLWFKRERLKIERSLIEDQDKGD